MSEPRRIAVMPGGGANGAVQAGALQLLKEEGLRFAGYTGISAGALNSLVAGTGDIDAMVRFWRDTRRKDVDGGINWWTRAPLLILGQRRALAEHDGLRSMIFGHPIPLRWKAHVRVGVVSLELGQTLWLDSSRNTKKEMRLGALASATIPGLWPPVTDLPGVPEAVDGGVAVQSPMGDAHNMDPDEIWVFHSHPIHGPAPEKMAGTIMGDGSRAAGLLMWWGLQKDLRETRRINRIVGQAAAAGLDVTRANGTAYKQFKLVDIYPTRSIGGGTLDFSAKSAQERITEGRVAAMSALYEYRRSGVSRDPVA